MSEHLTLIIIIFICEQTIKVCAECYRWDIICGQSTLFNLFNFISVEEHVLIIFFKLSLFKLLIKITLEQLRYKINTCFELAWELSDAV